MKKKILLLIAAIVAIMFLTSCSTEEHPQNNCNCGTVIDYHFDELAPPPIEPAYIIVRNDCTNNETTFWYHQMTPTQFRVAIENMRYCRTN